jgi:hypothetical protein
VKEVLAVAVDSTVLAMEVVVSMLLPLDEGRHGPALTPARATTETKKDFRDIMVKTD